MEWMILPLKRYADFTGRSRRKEFWLWIVFVILVSFVLGILDSLLGFGGRLGYGQSVSVAPDMVGRAYGAGLYSGVLTDIFMLAILVPNIAVAVRRLHDTDRSGWWLLLPVAPQLLGFGLMMAGALVLGGLCSMLGFIAAIVLLVWYCQPGIRGPNRFGADPLGAAAPLP
jgi:uncharacterized membrane protein YhaH (DUF805 family)